MRTKKEFTNVESVIAAIPEFKLLLGIDIYLGKYHSYLGLVIKLSIFKIPCRIER